MAYTLGLCGTNPKPLPSFLQVILLWLSIIVVPRCSLWDVFVTTMDLMVMSAAVAAPFVCCQAIWMAVFMVQVVTQVGDHQIVNLAK